MLDSNAIGIIGEGRVGRALANLLGRNHDVAITSRSIGPIAATCRRVIVAVPDSAIADVAAKLAASNIEIALHTCGSVGPSALAPLPSNGVACATFHPLQTFASADAGIAALPGSTFGICGERQALEWARELCAELDGTPLVIPEDKLALYHAAAVVAGNYAIGLVDVAAELMERAGVERQQALRAIAPLVRASAENALIMGPEVALTGPIERGDLETVERHLESLRAECADTDAIYRAVARRLVSIANRRGLDDKTASRCLKLLTSQANSV